MRLARSSVSPVNGWSGARDADDSKQRAQQGQPQLQTRLGALLLALVVLAVTASVALGYHLALHRVQLALSSQLGALHDAGTAAGSMRGAKDLLPTHTAAVTATQGHVAALHGIDRSKEGQATGSAAGAIKLQPIVANSSLSGPPDSADSKNVDNSSRSTSGGNSSILTALQQRPMAPVKFHPNVKELLNDQSSLDYTCYEPTAGLSSPVITIITIINLKPIYMAFVHTNRIAYAMKHGYRYCEQRRPDPARIAAFGRIPLTLAMAPCTDYLFHVDGDSLFFNHEAGLAPLVAQMQRADVDLLVGRDIIPQSPFNFGVFMLRPADWHWRIFKQVYNYCACDWSRMHDWPAEQGILYDLLVANADQPWAKRWQAISALNWNHLYPKWPDATGKELIVHLTNMPNPEPCEPGMHCKFKGVMLYWDAAVRSGKVANVTMPSPNTYTTTHNACQCIHFKALITVDNTYHAHGDRYSSSFLDYQPTGAGQYDLLLGELACLGWRDKKCKLKKYWNELQGTGPLQELMKEDVVINFFNADGSPKQ